MTGEGGRSGCRVAYSPGLLGGGSTRQVSTLDTPYELIRREWVGQRAFDVAGRPVNGAKDQPQTPTRMRHTMLDNWYTPR
jgi:hypothetical protein